MLSSIRVRESQSSFVSFWFWALVCSDLELCFQLYVALKIVSEAARITRIGSRAQLQLESENISRVAESGFEKEKDRCYKGAY